MPHLSLVRAKKGIFNGYEQDKRIESQFCYENVHAPCDEQ